MKSREDIGKEKATELIAKYKTALVIDEKGTNKGVMELKAAWALAQMRGMILNCVRDGESPVIRLEDPSVVLEDVGAVRRTLAMDKRTETLHERVKEVRLSEAISEHDLQVKLMKSRQHLLSKYKVLVELRYKKKADFDANVARAIMDNVVGRLNDVSTVEIPFKVADTGFAVVSVLLRPLPRKILIQRGLVELDDPDAPKELTRRQISAARRHLESLEKDELRAQGIRFKKYMSPDEQIRLAGLGSTNTDEDFKALDGINTKNKKKKIKRVEEKEDDMDDYRDDDYDEEDDEETEFEIPKGVLRVPISRPRSTAPISLDEDEDEDMDMDMDDSDRLMDMVPPDPIMAGGPRRRAPVTPKPYGRPSGAPSRPGGPSKPSRPGGFKPGGRSGGL